MLNGVYLFIGSGLGNLARWGASGFVARHWGETFPFGTLFVNVTGSFIIGLFAGLTGPQGRWLAPPAFRRFFMLGNCGGYTTFSSFSQQTLTLAEDNQWLKAGARLVGRGQSANPLPASSRDTIRNTASSGVAKAIRRKSNLLYRLARRRGLS